MLRNRRAAFCGVSRKFLSVINRAAPSLLISEDDGKHCERAFPRNGEEIQLRLNMTMAEPPCIIMKKEKKKTMGEEIHLNFIPFEGEVRDRKKKKEEEKEN